MNVETITMPRSEAADLAAVIRRQLLRRPILLKPIPNTTLYAVLATWDLTPVERAVIEQTRREAQHE